MLNANQKGKRFELRIAKDLAKKFDTNIRRTPNIAGNVRTKKSLTFGRHYIKVKVMQQAQEKHLL